MNEVIAVASKRLNDNLKIVFTLSRSWKDYALTIMEISPGGFAGNSWEFYYEDENEVFSAFNKITKSIENINSIDSIVEILENSSQ